MSPSRLWVAVSPHVADAVLFNIAALKGIWNDLTVVLTSVDLITDELNHLSPVGCHLASPSLLFVAYFSALLW